MARAIRGTHPDWNLVGIDNFCRIGSEINRLLIEKELGVEFYRGDIRNASDLEILPRCDYVIDAAANPTVLAGIDGKTSARQLVEHNLGGTVNLLEYCRAHGAGFILLSTSRIYSIRSLTQFDIEVRTSSTPGSPLGTCLDRYEPVNPSTFPIGLTTAGATETLSTTPPASLYGTTKVASEHLAVEYGAMCGFPVWINRCSVMGGAGQFAHPAQGIFGYWIHAFREGRPLKYIGFDGRGHQVRDGFHPRDLLPLLEKQIAEPIGSQRSPFTNLGGGPENSASLAELSAWCRTRFPNSRTIIPLSDGLPPVRAFDLPWFLMDNTRARENWGWEPRISLTELCEEIAQFAEANPEWLAMTG